MFEFQYILFAAAYLTGISQYVIRGRRRMMVVRTASSGMWVAYLAVIGAQAGAAASMIATIGCFIQAVVPDRLLKKTAGLRIGAACALCVAAMVFCVRSASDFLPLVAVMIARFVEVQACQQRIRMGLVACQLLWIVYHWSQGYILMYCAEHLTLAVNLASIWLEERKRRGLRPVDVPVTA